MLFYGTRFYGKVDTVPGLCHISTRFAHVQFIPLIPLGSYAVYEKSRFGSRGVLIGLNLKSVLTAWLRTILVLMFLMLASLACIRFAYGMVLPSLFSGFLAVLALSAYGYTRISRRFSRATFARAKQLANRVGMSDGECRLIDAVYSER